MSSRFTISSYARTVQERFIPALPDYWVHQFRFGVAALTLKPFVSLASNARSTIEHPDMASTNMDRLVGNGGLATKLSEIVAGLGIITARSILACDHSTMNGLMTFMGAIQTRRGRAIPCVLETLYSQVLPASDTTSKRNQKLRQARKAAGIHLYDQAMVCLEELAERLGFWPRLAFDRGFGGISFIRKLVGHKAIFYIRLKASRFVEIGGEQFKVSELDAHDTVITLDGMRLRVIRSDQPDEDGEPWYILTSDMTTSRKKVIRIYYHRFEIEETFKDLKHILDLAKMRLTKPLSLKILLWFAALRFILEYLASHKDPRYGAPRNPKKRVSWFRRVSEALIREAYQPLADLITGGI
jgi:transcriptional regulator with XRE-family HTH domain